MEMQATTKGVMAKMASVGGVAEKEGGKSKEPNKSGMKRSADMAAGVDEANKENEANAPAKRRKAAVSAVATAQEDAIKKGEYVHTKAKSNGNVKTAAKSATKSTTAVLTKDALKVHSETLQAQGGMKATGCEDGNEKANTKARRQSTGSNSSTASSVSQRQVVAGNKHIARNSKALSQQAGEVTAIGDCEDEKLRRHAVSEEADAAYNRVNGCKAMGLLCKIGTALKGVKANVTWYPLRMNALPVKKSFNKAIQLVGTLQEVLDGDDAVIPERDAAAAQVLQDVDVASLTFKELIEHCDKYFALYENIQQAFRGRMDEAWEKYSAVDKVFQTRAVSTSKYHKVVFHKKEAVPKAAAALPAKTAAQKSSSASNRAGK